MSMPRKMSTLALTDAEKDTLACRDTKGKPKEIYIQVIDPSLRRWELALKKWCYGTTWSYVLCDGWNKLAKHSGLVKGDILQVWSFRMEKDARLAFAIVQLQPNTNPTHILPGSRGEERKRRRCP
ncbi:hypothetical protein Dimus_015533 [Dionaea muscipula]